MRAARLCVMGSALMLACTAQADNAARPAAGKSAAAGAAATPDARGQAILQAQLAAVKTWSDSTPMDATFAPTAFVLLPNGARAAAGGNVASAIAFLNPHATVKAATFDHFTAGGNAAVAWFSADLHFTLTSGGAKPTTEHHTVRAIELLDSAAGWKVAVAAFTNVDKLQPGGSCVIGDATPPGALAKLLAAPEALAAALDPNAVVLGTDPAERGAGPAAKAQVARWGKLKLVLDAEQKAREVHTASYGYAMTNVQIISPKPNTDPLGMSGFVLALPGPKDTWTVVAASYGATF